MASISNDPGGYRRIQFVRPGGGRATIRLGKVSRKAAEAFGRRVEQLLECLCLNQPVDAELASWAGGLRHQEADKLVRHGLLPARRAVEAVALGSFIRRYVDGRNDVKPATKEIWRQGEKGLCGYFGAARLLVDITPGDAECYKQQLILDRLATATIKKRLDFGRQVFASAVKHRLVTENPFAEVRIKVSLPDKLFFISRDETERLIDASLDEDWRIIIALSRYGGLRCPSEVLSLRWAGVNWDKGTMVVESPKTAHHPGKDRREIPIFGFLLPHLERALRAATEDATYVVGGSYREKAVGPSGWRNVCLRKPFLAIIDRAGLRPWPHLFHNLRSSRASELMSEHSPSDVCRWMGHSMRVAERHYLQTRPEAIAAAVAEGRNEAAHKPAQQGTAGSCKGLKMAASRQPTMQGFSAPCDSSRTPAKPTSGEGGIRTRGPAFDRTRL
jgi:integrase